MTPCFIFLGAWYNKTNSALTTLFHFLKSLTQEGNHALNTLFHFLMSLTQDKKLYSNRPHHNEQDVITSKSSTPDGRKTSWKS